MKSVFTLVACSLISFAASAEDYFAASSKDLTQILSNPVFQRYGAFTIGTIRQGELGQAQAYFIRLVKPFATVEKGVCVEFVNPGNWELKGQPYACEE